MDFGDLLTQLCIPKGRLDYTYITYTYPYKHFMHCRVGLPAARVGLMEAKVVAYLHPAAFQWALQSWPPSSKSRPRGGQGGRLFTSSGFPVGL